MSDDLVKRLRHGTAGDKERHAAADRIEKLEEDVGVLIAASIRLSSRIDIDTDPYVDRIEKLEAALREIDKIAISHTKGGIVQAQFIARKALEGKDD
jgi:hypothetical protein